GAQAAPGELRVGVRVFDGQSAAGEHTNPADVFGESGCGVAERLGPGRVDEVAVVIAHEWAFEPVLRRGVLESPAPLVAVPLLVDVLVGSGKSAQHLAASPV